MPISFRKAAIPDEIPALIKMDRRIFPPSDCFGVGEWLAYESYWMLADDVKVGCWALEPRPWVRKTARDTQFDVRYYRTLYIATTGVLPKFRRRGYGLKMKRWQIRYARQHGYKRIAIDTRASNTRMIALNEKLGFRIILQKPGYYAKPKEAAVYMELVL